MQLTPEQVRMHAAGHIAAAALCVASGHTEAAKLIMQTVLQFVNSERVNAPPQLIEMVTDATKAPEMTGLIQLEEWFVHSFNTVIERSGAFR